MAAATRYRTFTLKDGVNGALVNAQEIDETIEFAGDEKGEKPPTKYVTDNEGAIRALLEHPAVKEVTTAYEDMSAEELAALAARRTLDVKRADGKDGKPVKADYIAALKAADEPAKGGE